MLARHTQLASTLRSPVLGWLLILWPLFRQETQLADKGETATRSMESLETTNMIECGQGIHIQLRERYLKDLALLEAIKYVELEAPHSVLHSCTLARHEAIMNPPKSS